MPSIVQGELIRALILRNNLSKSDLSRKISIDYTTLLRIENNELKPTKEILHKLLSELDFPLETAFYPWIKNQSPDILQIKDRLIYLLSLGDSASLDEAEALISELEANKDFGVNVGLQFILNYKTRINEKRLGNPVDTVEMVRQGMAISFKSFNEQNFDGGLLMLFEAELLHTLAKAYVRLDRVSDAISLLNNIQEGIRRLSLDDIKNEKELLPILLTQTNLLIDTERYDEALILSKFGNDASLKYHKGKFTPAFLYNMAVCEGKLGNLHESRACYQLSYFGYILLQRQDHAKRVLGKAKAQRIFFETYNVENLIFDKIEPSFERGNPGACNEVGTLIAVFRESAGLNQRELSAGICTQGTLSRAESNRFELDVFKTEALMQRLGRDIDQYFTTVISKKDFEDKQIRDDILLNIAAGKFAKAEAGLKLLKDKKTFESGVKLQFIKFIDANIYLGKNGGQDPQYLEKLIDAIKVTIPHFSEDKIYTYRLTYYEINIILGIANHYFCIDNISWGLKLYESLIESMDSSYVDEHEKIRTYTGALYNYSRELSNVGRHDESLEVNKTGAALCVKHTRLALLYRYADNRAFNLLNRDDNNESCIPYYALAYYGCKIAGQKHELEKIAIRVKNELGIEFD